MMLRILYSILLLPAVFSPVLASPPAGLDQNDSSGNTKPIIPRAEDNAGPSITTSSTPKPSRGAIVLNIGTFTVTARPTGFKVGSAAVTPGGEITIGTETLLLKTGGKAIVLDESTVSFEKRPQTLTSIAAPTNTGDSTSIHQPPNTHTSSKPYHPGGGNTSSRTRKGPTTTKKTHSTSDPSSSGGGKPPSHTSSQDSTTRSDPPTTSGSSSSTRTTPSSSAGGETPSSLPPSSRDTTTRSGPSTTKKSTTKKNTPTATHSTPKPSQSESGGSFSHTASTRASTASDSTSDNTATRTRTTPGPSHTGPGETTAPPTTSPTSANDWTTLSDSSTTGLYAFVILSDYKSLTTPTIITTQYIESSSKTTTGPIFVGTGGTVLQSWPPSKNDNDDDGGALIIPDPIRPSISDPKLKCPAILKWLCGPDHTSSTNGGPDVNPAAKPNSDPADDPNKDDDGPTSDPTSETSATSTKDTTTTDSTTSTSKSSSSTSSCTQTQTVTNCAAKCTPTVISSKTTTTCHTTSCSTVTACSTTGTISTTLISTSSQPCGSGTASACPTFSTPIEWVYPEEKVDTAEVDKLASSILSEDASIWKEFSSILAETGSSTTLATTTSSRTSSGPATRTTITRHSAPLTTTSTKSTKTKTSSGTSTTTSALSCVHQYSSTDDQETCYCEGHDGNREVMSSSSGMTDYQPCAWTTLPPLYTDDNVGPITSTLDSGDVISCSSAHWASGGTSRKYCLGSVSTISTATHSTTSTTSSEGVSPTGSGDPTGEMYIGIVTEGYSFSWNVFIPDVGDIPDWCDDSMGYMSADGDTNRYSLPPDIKFQDLKGKASKYPCTYTAGDDGKVGKLACAGMGEVPCTGDFDQSDDSPLCTNSVVYAGSAFPRVYCKWYGSDHSL